MMNKFLFFTSIGLLLSVYYSETAPVLENPNVVDIVSSNTCKPVSLDFNRYFGKWYEVGRSFFFIYGVGCKCTTAEYTQLDDGEIGIKNSCVQFGRQVVTEGVGNATDTSLGSFEVEFKNIPYSGKANYNVLWIDDKYENAIVASCDLPFVGYNIWILSRNQNVDESHYKVMIGRIESLGFKTWMMLRTDQVDC